MEHRDVLMAIAQVAATFIGFASVVFAVGRASVAGVNAPKRTALIHLLLPSILVLFLAFAPVVAFAGAKSSGGNHGVIETDKGAIQIEFFAADAPKAVENFRLLAEHGYYDGLTFHRIVKGFMIQGGDPAGDGTGGQSAWGPLFADEINPASPLYQAGYRRGIIAMANAGPNTNGSQFFILHDDYPLPPQYVIFAKVTAGMDVVDALANTPTTMGPDGGMSQPLTPPTIKGVTIRP